VIQIAILLAGTALLAFVLFVRAPQPDAIQSSWRWMIFAWGIFTLFALTSPVTYDRMAASPWTIVYLGLWVLAFVLGDRWAYRRGEEIHPVVPGAPVPASASPRAEDGAMEGATAHRRGELLLFRILIALSIAGAGGFIYVMLSAVDRDAGALLAELRQLLVDGEIASPGATALQLLASAGLPVALILIADAIRQGRPVPLLAWFGILASESIYMTTAGRQGLAFASFASIVTVVASFAQRTTPYLHRRSLFGPLVAVLLVFAGYFVYNVATRGTVDGDMDAKLEMIERVYGAYVDPEFRESVRPLGSLGDTACELYLYLGTQLPGLTALLREYRPGPDLGLGLVPFFTRRLESLTGLALLEPIYEGQKEVFINMGMPGNFYLTAAGSTFESFGGVGALLVVWAVGALCGWHRRRVQASPIGRVLAIQALLCAGAMFTIIYWPTIEAGFSFPLLWLLVLPLLLRWLPAPTPDDHGGVDAAAAT
jgi:hypothetical protein